jgi:hypothetical protein
LERLLDASHPAPLRLLAADALLMKGPFEPAVAALRDTARMPNREIALMVAQIVQRRLGVDLGINLNQPPELHTRQAADVTRRVIQWAADPSAASPSPDDFPLPGRVSGINPRRSGSLRRPGPGSGIFRR